jgi:RNA polymerase sigma-70 factor (ECF subfamily)
LTVNFEAAFEAYHTPLYRYVAKLTGDPDLAADAAQEAFVRLSQRPPRHFGNLRAWLYTVATNYALDTLKVSRRRMTLLGDAAQRSLLADCETAPDLDLERRERREVVRAALNQLRERERVALLMRAEGFSYKEVGNALGVSVNSVGVIAARALRKLAAALQPQESQLV